MAEGLPTLGKFTASGEKREPRQTGGVLVEISFLAGLFAGLLCLLPGILAGLLALLARFAAPVALLRLFLGIRTSARSIDRDRPRLPMTNGRSRRLVRASAHHRSLILRAR